MRVNVLVLLVSAFVAWFGCGDNLHPSSNSVMSVTVTPQSASVAAGNTVQLTAMATYSDGTTSDVTGQATWTSSDTAVATVNANGTAGLIRGAAAGTTTITATFEAQAASATVTVTDASIESLGLTPPTATMPKGTTLDVIATAVYSDATTADVSDTATWTSSDEAVATVSATGTVTAVDIGTATITATLGGISSSMDVTVTSATLASIEVTPTAPSIADGTTIPFTATGIYTDGTQQTLTTQVTWSSSGAAASISNADGSQGVATGEQAGTVTITATDPTSNISGSTTLEVTSVVLTAIQIDPLDATLPAGSAQAYTATGIYSDSTTQDITSSVNWSSGDASVATVGADGTVTAVAGGDTTITATDPTTNISASTTVTVTTAVLTKITILPSAPSVAKGTSLQFTAEGLYSDLSTRDITTEVTWQSSDTATAQVSNADGSQGFTVTLGVGSTTISATDPTTNVTGSTTLTVTNAVLVRIDVDPANETLPRGSGELYTATGVYSDFTTQDLTTFVTWSSSNTTAATISNAAGSEGLVTTLAAGTTTITALDPATGITGTAKLVVGTSVLLGITISPLTPTIAKGGRIQFRCVGTYDDGTMRDITQFVTWASSSQGNASISNAPKKRGLAQGKNPGTSTISCTDPGTGISASTLLTVTGATLTSISITPVNASTPAGTHIYYTAVGHYSDGSTSDFTSSVSWSSSNTSVATISNQTFQWGTAAAVSPGTTTITALDVASGISATTTLTVTNATLVSLSITPSNPTVIANTQTQLTATGMFSDGSTVDVTRDVTWTSSMPNVATVLNVGATKGTVTGVAAGMTTITANYPLTITSATTTVTVIL